MHYAGVTSNTPSTVPARLELDAYIQYEASKLGLWRAICKRNPQLALFSEVYGDSPDSGAEWVPYSTSGITYGEPVRLTEPRQARGWGRTMLGRMGLTVPGRVASAPIPPDAADASAPTTSDVDGPLRGAKEVP